MSDEIDICPLSLPDEMAEMFRRYPVKGRKVKKVLNRCTEIQIQG